MPTESPPELECPLCVDLDGTLIATDLLWEAFLDVVRSRPWVVLQIPGWLWRGRAYLKGRIAEQTQLDVATLPYREEVILYLQEQRASGRRLILATAADERLARAVDSHLGLFDDLIASDGLNNLKGEQKLAAIRQRCGAGGFDYLGDSKSDLPLWGAAGRAILVHPSHRLLDRASRVCKPAKVFEAQSSTIKAAVRALRPHQWAKNLLLIVPLIMAHQWADPGQLLRILIAFLAFSAAASAVYLLNDLVDLPSDRRHPNKRLRPLAAGLLPIPAALGLFVLMLVLAAGFASSLPPKFGLMLLAYMGLTTAYSLALKRKLMVDVICLAALYTHRILAGGAATSIVISPWLLAFSVFFFLSLAFAKRYTELDTFQGSMSRVPGRGYAIADLEMIRSMGPSSGYLCVLLLCLYINAPEVTKLYHHPERLWLICPVLLYWISRIWFLAHRRELPHDPVTFALRDRISYLAGAIIAVVLVMAT